MDAIVLEPIGGQRADLSRAAQRAAFRAAVGDFECESGGRRVAVDGLPGAVGFRIASAQVNASLAKWHRAYEARGAAVMRFESNFGYAPDGVLVLPITDQFEVVRAIGTDGVNWGILNRGILRWLRRLYRDQPFVLTGAGIDFVEGYFREPVRDPVVLARRFYRFCPDVVDLGTGSVAALAKELRATNALYCWWD